MAAPPAKRAKACQEKRYKTVLIGETGAGKSTFVELLLNYAKQFGMVFDLKKVSSFVESEARQNDRKSYDSDTTYSKKYMAKYGDFVLEIIDTPGFADTRGDKQNERNIANIINEVRKEHYVNSVCLIISGTEVRLSDVMKKVIQAIISILPPDVLNNVIIVYTKTQDKYSLKFDRNVLKEFQLSVPKERTFLTDNPYARLQYFNENPNDVDEDDKKVLLDNFEKTHRILDQMFGVTKGLKPALTVKFGEYHEAVKEIEISLAELRLVFENKKEVQQLLEKADLNTMTKIEYSKIIVTTSGKSHVVCVESGCNTNCHKDCDCWFTFVWIGMCSQFSYGECKVCRHSSWYHRRVGYYYDRELREIKLPNLEKKQCLEKEMELYNHKLEKESIILQRKLKNFQSVGSSGFFSENAKKYVDNLRKEIKSIPGEEWKTSIVSILDATMETLEEPRTASDEDAKLRWASGMLGLDPEKISHAELKKQYKERARMFHPDTSRDEYTSGWFKNLEYAKEFISRKLGMN